MTGRWGCVIMASGLGRRFGGNKLLADFRGEPLVSRALRATEGLFEYRVMVTRYPEAAALAERAGAAAVLHELPFRSDTVRLGLETMKGTDGCMFLPADQPLLRHETVRQLLEHAKAEPDRIWRPAYGGEPGAPVVFPARFYEELSRLPQGKGGGWIIRQHPEAVRLMPVDDPAELRDVDTPEDLKELAGPAVSSN